MHACNKIRRRNGCHFYNVTGRAGGTVRGGNVHGFTREKSVAKGGNIISRSQSPFLFYFFLSPSRKDRNPSTSPPPIFFFFITASCIISIVLATRPHPARRHATRAETTINPSPSHPGRKKPIGGEFCLGLNCMYQVIGCTGSESMSGGVFGPALLIAAGRGNPLIINKDFFSINGFPGPCHPNKLVTGSRSTVLSSEGFTGVINKTCRPGQEGRI